MGRLIVYCDGCGERIVEEQIEKGKAHQENGRYFCNVCRPLSPSVGTKVPAAHAQAYAHGSGTIKSTQHASRPPAHSKPPTRRSTVSQTPMIVGIGVAAVAILGLVFVFGGSRERVEPAAATLPAAGAQTPVPNVAADPLADQKKAVTDVKKYVSSNPDDHKGTVSRVTVAMTTVTDAGLLAQLKDLKSGSEAKLAEAAAEATCGDFLKRAEETRAGDAEFRMVVLVRGYLAEARKVASGRAKLFKQVLELEADYDRGVDAAAEKSWTPVCKAADALNSGGKPQDAIAHLENFPGHLRERQWATRFADRKRTYEDHAAQLAREPKKATIWEDYQKATSLINQKNYADGGRILNDVLSRCANRELMQREGLTQQQITEIATNGQYNLACYYAREVKDRGRALSLIENALKFGFNQFEHMEKDEDLVDVREEERWAPLVRKYRRGKELTFQGSVLTGEEARKVGAVDGNGAVSITNVPAGCQAEKSGFKAGDIIVEIDGKPFGGADASAAFYDAIGAPKDNVDVPFGVLRGGKKIVLKFRFTAPK